MAAMIAAALASAELAAQTATSTVSSGYMESNEYVQGEVTITYSYLATITPLFNGAPVGPDLNWFDYYDPRTTSEGQALFAQFMETNGPAPDTFDVGGVAVDVVSWSDPQLLEAESYEEFIDANYFTRSYTTQSQGVTVQLTSGDESDASVPVGNRGECFSPGGNGPTNYGPGGGYFADCMEGDYVDLDPGTINTNTHTTYYTVHVDEEVGNEDWQAKLFYNLTPQETRSSSSATSTQESSSSEERRIDNHAVQFRGEVGGQVRFDQRFEGQFGEAAVEAGLAELTRPQSGTPQQEGAPIVLSWSAPELVRTNANLLDRQVSTETSSQNSTLATTEISTRGLGAAGVTATIGEGVNYNLSEGETHTHTRTTRLTENLTTILTTENWLNTNTYRLTPRETLTSSRGRLTLEHAASEYRRNDSYATQLRGVVSGTTLFDRTFAGQFADASVQAGLNDLAQPTGYSLDGAPILVMWSAPQLQQSSQSLLERQVGTQTRAQTSTVVTTQTSIRGRDDAAIAVPYGDRGSCTDSGATGLTMAEGSLATCEGGTDYVLSPGETNTNTHTTLLTENLTTTITTENWLNTSTYQVNGTATPVGQSYSAVNDVLFDDGDFAGRQRTALSSTFGASNQTRSFGPWVMLHASEANRDANAAGAGHHRTARGVSGGLAFRLANNMRAGIALDHSDSDLDVDGQQESSTVELLRVAGGLALVMPANWHVDLMAGHAWSDVETERGGAANGGTSRADYDADLWFTSARLGPEFTLSRSLFRPFAEINWTRATVGDFAESGNGVALVGREEDMSRTEVVAGAQFDLRWDLNSGSRFGITAELLGGEVVDGTERERTVAFAATPDALLLTSSAEESSSFARGRLGLTFATTEGLRFHLGVDGRVAENQDSWQANAGVSVAF